MADDLAGLIAAADLQSLPDNDPLRTKARNLIGQLLDEAEFLLNNATPAIRAGLIRSVVPSLVRALKEEHSASDEMVQMREEVRALMAAATSGMGGGAPQPQSGTVPTDNPDPDAQPVPRPLPVAQARPSRLVTPQTYRKDN